MEDKTIDGKELAAGEGRILARTCGDEVKDLARDGEKSVRWGEIDTHLVEIGKGEVRAAAT